ncbi:MAG: protein translocase subunit SecF [Gammaproteobacteria bacterium]|nr:protein translocase subunit SecF [Gammaproteobacteria bacterium]
MRLFKETPNYDFMGKGKIAIAVSLLVLLLGTISLVVRGLPMGIDFTGGTLVEVGYQEPADLTVVRGALHGSGFGDAIVQHFGSSKDVLVRVAPREELSNAKLSEQLMLVLQKTSQQPVEMRRVEYVGPQVGDELFEKGGLALLTAMACILVYVWLRFEKRFAAGSIIALVHDIWITVGILSIFQVEFDLTVFAAILAVIGYSLNDTIVVFDRVRDNFRMMRKSTPREVINTSVNQTLSRTTMTSFTTVLVLLALFFYGGELIHGFATALLIGIAVGTFSSIYVASASVLLLGVSREDLMPPQKEGEDADGPPLL